LDLFREEKRINYLIGSTFKFLNGVILDFLKTASLVYTSLILFIKKV